MIAVRTIYLLPMGHKFDSTFFKGKMETLFFSQFANLRLKKLNYLRYMQDINVYEFSQGFSLKKTVLYDVSFIIHQIINFMGLFLLSEDLKLFFYSVIASGVRQFYSSGSQF